MVKYMLLFLCNMQIKLIEIVRLYSSSL